MHDQQPPTWREVAFTTGPADRAEAEAGVRAAYLAAGLAPPERVVWLSSPAQGAIAAAVLTGDAKTRSLLHSALAARGTGGEAGRDDEPATPDHQPDGRGGVAAHALRHGLEALLPEIEGVDAGASVRDLVRTEPWARARAEAVARWGGDGWARVWALTGAPLWPEVERLVSDIRQAIGSLAASSDEVTGLLRRATLDAVHGQQDAPWLAAFDEPAGAPIVEGPAGAPAQTQAESASTLGGRAPGSPAQGRPVSAPVQARPVSSPVEAQPAGSPAQVRPAGSSARERPGSAGDHHLDGLRRVARAAGWWWPYERVVLMCERPARHHRDELGRLHRADGPALEFPDGFALHAWRGMPVPAGFSATMATLDADRIRGEENAELRRVMLEHYGYDRYIAESGAQPVHRDETGVLWRVDLAGDEPLTMVEVVNSTPEPDGTSRTYFLRVPPWVTRARQGVAWTFDLAEAGYQPQRET
ncbi:DUF6745 domain-containing protein [Nonomuraea sp. NPDC050691]|uniref:DUF6745 domain-containing protein n=1 Tax=Nonomuraea sp. NPDC050691 TaxID=3155661 RepID=UPI00340FF621